MPISGGTPGTVNVSHAINTPYICICGHGGGNNSLALLIWNSTVVPIAGSNPYNFDFGVVDDRTFTITSNNATKYSDYILMKIN